MASHPSFSGVVNLLRVASRLLAKPSLLSTTPNHWRMGTFIGCYENVRARVISLLAVTMLTTFFADPAAAQEREMNNEFAVRFAGPIRQRSCFQ